jgi:hypothetical protein
MSQAGGEEIKGGFRHHTEDFAETRHPPHTRGTFSKVKKDRLTAAQFPQNALPMPGVAVVAPGADQMQGGSTGA